MFWVVTLFLGMGGGGRVDPTRVLVWVAVVFVSVLVHELGHAFLQRYFRGHPWITLYSFGGLASCNDCDRSPRSQILISLAGPAAGFLFAACIVAMLAFFQKLEGFEFSWMPVKWTLFDPLYAMQHQRYGPVDLAIANLLFVNIVWGLVNLLPIYPLDGGRITRELFTLGNAQRGIIQSLRLSAAVAAIIAVYAMSHKEIFLCIMFGMLAYESFQTLQQYSNRWR